MVGMTNIQIRCLQSYLIHVDASNSLLLLKTLPKFETRSLLHIQTNIVECVIVLNRISV